MAEARSVAQLTRPRH